MDVSLIEGIRQNNEQIFSEIYQQYHAKLYFYFLNKIQVSDVCADLVQTTFIKCWNYRHHFDTTIPLSQQIFRIAKTTLIDLLRQKARERLVRLEECPFVSEISELQTSCHYRLDEVTATLDQIPPERRKIVKFRLEGLTNHEIAVSLGISKKTVENQLNKAIKEIRTHICSPSNLSLILLLVYLLQDEAITYGLQVNIN